MRPEKMVAVSDSVYFASFYTFGPTTVRLHVLDKDYPFAVLPNHTSTIKISGNGNAIDFLYSGPFKEIFEESESIYNLTGKGYYKHIPKAKKYESALDYRDAQLTRVNSVLSAFNPILNSSTAKTFFSNSFRMFMLTPLCEYPRHIILSNQNAGMDSLEAHQQIPSRNLDYYSGIVDSHLADTASLLSGAHYEFLNAMAKDTLLGLPHISDVDINQYKARLIDNFEPIFDAKDNLFFDMMIANAFIDQISRGVSLSDRQIFDIIDYFKNPEIPNYIFHEHKRSLVAREQSSSRFYLPFEQDSTVMESILEDIKNKVVVLDFWATWCGPCIEAFGESKPVKEEFADKEVAFVYVTDETSDVQKWHEFVAVLGGEHYYISRKQMLALYDEFGFSSIPAYLIYDKHGGLIEMTIGYMGNKRLKEVISKLLD
ncbi:TlpA family protein disulfide reductase [Parapedobacter sp. DT-150]|uniref:TlpA family protein disulfide reductase n=1 Tax=Parapedobacter sp. DT-150 TaxID=3396162 RepID=UPI003F1D57B3